MDEGLVLKIDKATNIINDDDDSSLNFIIFCIIIIINIVVIIVIIIDKLWSAEGFRRVLFQLLGRASKNTQRNQTKIQERKKIKQTCSRKINKQRQTNWTKTCQTKQVLGLGTPASNAGLKAGDVLVQVELHFNCCWLSNLISNASGYSTLFQMLLTEQRVKTTIMFDAVYSL